MLPSVCIFCVIVLLGIFLSLGEFLLLDNLRGEFKKTPTHRAETSHMSRVAKIFFKSTNHLCDYVVKSDSALCILLKPIIMLRFA